MMYKIRFLAISALFFFVSFSSSALAAMTSPLGLSIFPPLQFPAQNFNVTGARVNLLWGSHNNVYGFDVGALGNITAHEMAGIQIGGLFNVNNGETTAVGLQLAGGANINVNKAHVVGVQAAGIMNQNRAESSALGMIVSLLNLTEHTKITGMEIGLVNIAREVYGFQIGLVNKVQNLHGLQIGLLNINTQGLFSVSTILNAGF